MNMLEIIENDINATIERLKELETVEYREFASRKNIDINESKRFVTEKFRALLELRDRLKLLYSPINLNRNKCETKECVQDDLYN
jgi:hypothetical protein